MWRLLRGVASGYCLYRLLEYRQTRRNRNDPRCALRAQARDLCWKALRGDAAALHELQEITAQLTLS